jgi:large subunit ribosomal protein L31e
MAKAKTRANEREYIINLRRETLKVPRYKRTPKAIKAIKQFIAKHMRIPDRDLNKVKLDKYLNQEMWFRGIENPLRKVKVKVKRDGDNVLVELAELPDKIKFQKLREEKLRESSEKVKSEKKQIEKPIEETTEEKKERSEKIESVKEAEEKQADKMAKEQKHVQKVKPAKTERIQRKALQK